jgi:hypothetical protein
MNARIVSTCLALCALALGVAPDVQAEERDAAAVSESEQLFERANVLYEARQYAEALALLQRAYALNPLNALLFNIAQAQRQLGLCSDSRRTYDAYLRRETDANARERARVGLERLRGCEGAEPAPVPASKPVPARRRSAPEPRTRPAEPETSSPARSYTWVGWTATGVFAAGAAASGLLMLSALDERRQLESRPATTDEVDDAESRARRYALAADVLSAAAIVSAGVSLYFTLSSREASRERAGAVRASSSFAQRSVAIAITF